MTKEAQIARVAARPRFSECVESYALQIVVGGSHHSAIKDVEFSVNGIMDEAMKEKSSMKLFLDDERFPPDTGDLWEVVRSTAEAIDYVSRNGVPEFISFDHDLGGEDTAMNFANWLISRDIETPGFISENFKFVIHSQNPVGAKNLESLLNRYLQFREQAKK